MQHWELPSATQGFETFSILGRIGGDATTLQPCLQMNMTTFSILGRIGGDATHLKWVWKILVK